MSKGTRLQLSKLSTHQDENDNQIVAESGEIEQSEVQMSLPNDNNSSSSTAAVDENRQVETSIQSSNSSSRTQNRYVEREKTRLFMWS
jgi:hypothetical protein